MNVRKHAFAIVFGSILAIAAGGIGFLLFRSHADYTQVKDKLAQAESRYNTLTSAKPFPSPENVEVVKENAESVKIFYDELLVSLCENQPPREDVTKNQFTSRLQDTIKDLRLMASNETLVVELLPTPEQFYFGFAEYTTGVLPERRDIPRLLGQLRNVESVCHLLFDNRISGLISIRRDVFERPQGSDGASMARMGRGFVDDMDFAMPTEDGTTTAITDTGSDLYSIEHFDLVFHARDSQVWAVLDALGSSPQFSVVTSIELRNLSNGQNRPSPTRPTSIRQRMPRGGMGFDDGFEMEDAFFDRASRRPSRLTSLTPTRTEDGGLRMLSHEERVVAGRDELVEVVLGLDVYRFCPEPANDEEEGTEPVFEG